MTIKNDTDSRYANDTNRFALSISDTNEHDFPDVDGDDAGSAGSGFNVGSAESIVAKVVNNQDQSLTAKLEATTPTDHDSFSEPNELVAGTSVSSGSVSSLVWREETDGDYSQLRIVLSFDSTPSGSNDTIVEFRKDQ